MKTVAIITARGGSKRIPRKNIKDFCGKPIIAYSIEAALKSGVFDTVMVSTDDGEIAEISREYGAEVPFLRSSKTSGDYAATADVITEVLNEYLNRGIVFDYFACIYPTAPFLNGEKLSEAFNSILSQKADAVLSVVKYSFPPQRAFIIKEGKVEYQFPEFERTRSQDLEPVFHDCGQFYICLSKSFFEHSSMILPRTIPYIIPEEEVQDIDTMSDWKIAEAKYRVLQNQ